LHGCGLRAERLHRVTMSHIYTAEDLNNASCPASFTYQNSREASMLHSHHQISNRRFCISISCPATDMQGFDWVVHLAQKLNWMASKYERHFH
jgi:hypothetical protein